MLAATRGKKMKDTTLLSLQTKREEAGSLLASAEARRRGDQGRVLEEINALNFFSVSGQIIRVFSYGHN